MKKTYNIEGAPKAIGPYSHAVSADGLFFLSGQIPIVPETGNIEDTTIEGQTEQVLKNIGTVLKGLGLDYADVVKTTVFLTDMNDFAKVNAVYGKYFTADFPARSAVQVGALPKGALVEIELVAQK
ncbi:MAG: RidA family protein [Christensenellaceae bacterium]|nr:RidA family protein [Christensenellaceae bacterium]